MKICLKQTGGIAAFAKPLGGTVEVDELPEALANEAKRMLRPDVLHKAATAPGQRSKSQGVDQQEIKVGIWQNDKYREFILKEENTDPELFDLCSDIIHELVRRQIDKRS